MLEIILKYTSLLGAIISLLIGLLKYLDQRNREQSEKTFAAFHNMVCRAAGQRERGGNLPFTQQLAAIYQLQKYKEYSYASIPVLKYMKEDFESKEEDPRKNGYCLQSMKH